MFENIIGQREITATLRAELTEGRFPRSSLFFGPPYAAKLSTALEAARVLTCREGRGEWSCECQSCRLQRELAHPHTMLLGPRYFDVEIAACAAALQRNRKAPTQYLFLRAVRKLTRRFDTSILDTDDARVKGALEKVSRIEEQLTPLEPGAPLPPEDALSDLLESIVSACVALGAHARGDGLTIGQVRRLAAWSHLSATDSRKVAIIENADRMQDSARNALLKLLEEPPLEVSFILLTTRRAAIIPTILSRMRPYPFDQRPPSEEKEVMTKIFREEAPSAESLRGYFLAWKEINPDKLSGLSKRFMELVLDPGAGPVDIAEEMSGLLPARSAAARGGRPERSPREAVVSFLEELTFRFSDVRRQGGAEIHVLEEWVEAVRDAFTRLDVYNITAPTVVEALFYRMRDAFHGESLPPAGGAGT
jgi:DNA polymerase III delta prime subunit